MAAPTFNLHGQALRPWLDYYNEAARKGEAPCADTLGASGEAALEAIQSKVKHNRLFAADQSQNLSKRSMNRPAFEAAFSLSLPASQKIVLVVLAWNMKPRENQTSMPLEQIAKYACMSRGSVIRALSNLERAGLIERCKTCTAKGQQDENSYRLNLVQPDKPGEGAKA